MQIALNFWNEILLPKKLIVYKEIINDRNSKYTVLWAFVESLDEVNQIINYIKKDKYFKNATHNSYAYRFKINNWVIIEWKNDDWEIWAWMCILRELQRNNWLNMILVVTRYFWWIKLQSDRFKNVILSCKIFFENISKIV